MAAEHSASGGEGGRTETAAPAEIAGELSAKMIAHARQSFEIASPLPLLARRERRLLACNRKQLARHDESTYIGFRKY
jgi:hypothetical protein